MRTTQSKSGFTIVELTVVILILSILASISVSVYSGYVERARFARAYTEIREIELNVVRYENDLGEFPLSSSGMNYAALPPNPMQSINGGAIGCGYLTLCLRQSLSGNSQAPASLRWHGPYMEAQQEQLGDLRGNPITLSTPAPQVCFLDPWNRPYVFVRSADYSNFNATHQQDTPFVAAGEIYYNPGGVQIYSLGPDGETPGAPEAGLGNDDVNNFNNR